MYCHPGISLVGFLVLARRVRCIGGMSKALAFKLNSGTSRVVVLLNAEGTGVSRG